MKFTKITAAVLLAAMLLVSCAAEEGSAKALTESGKVSETVPETEAVYPYELSDTETIDLGIATGVTNTFLSEQCGRMVDGKHEFMSAYESQKQKLELNIENLFPNK